MDAQAVASAVSFVVALVGCEAVRSFAVRRALLDRVNERSLHTAPTPRLGGVAIVAAALAAYFVGRGEAGHLDRLALTGAAVALLGLVDDLRPTSAAARILVQIAIVAGFLWWTGVPPLLVARGVELPLSVPVRAVAFSVWVVGLTNIYNFMDGMDGLAGSQGFAATFALGLLAPSAGGLLAPLGAACLAFLAHNAPPARIFMGDAGSTFIGYTVAASVVLLGAERIPVTEGALVVAPFLLDGTFTLLRRASRRERVWTAHRTHLYQRAVQTGKSHREVLLVYVAWEAACVLAALVAGRGAPFLIAGWAAALGGLVLVWRWVVRRESAEPARA